MAAPLGLTFAAEGANVAFHFNSSGDGAVEAAELARGLSVKADAIGADLRDRAAVEAAVAPAAAELGPIGVLVNTAEGTQSEPVLDTTEDDWMPQINAGSGSLACW